MSREMKAEFRNLATAINNLFVTVKHVDQTCSWSSSGLPKYPKRIVLGKYVYEDIVAQITDMLRYLAERSAKHLRYESSEKGLGLEGKKAKPPKKDEFVEMEPEATLIALRVYYEAISEDIGGLRRRGYFK